MTHARSSRWLRAGTLAAALAFACAAQAANPVAAPDVATDPAGAWTHFLAHGDGSKAYKAYAALEEVGYDGNVVDPAACGTQGAQLRAAIQDAPISLALRRAAMLCAEAAGDDAAAEREMVALAALAKEAFAPWKETANSRPIRVLRPQDGSALMLALGLEPRYAYYPWWRAQRYFPVVAVAWDPELKVERQLRLDFLDATVAVFREPQSKYPHYRSEVVDALLGAMRENDVAEAVDALAWKEGRATDDPAAKIAKFRMGATVGGVQSARTWLMYCSEQDAVAHCGDGLVDTLLPLAEKQHAWPTMLLAYAYANGIGVKRDEAMAMQLLDAADARTWRHFASLEYALLWTEAHDSTALPKPVLEHLDRAIQAGNEDARMLRIALRIAGEPTTKLDEQDIAFLSQPSQNGRGEGYAVLSRWAEKREAEAEHKRWRKLAADAGQPSAQADEGYAIAYDDDGPKDLARGLAYIEKGAQGGNGWAARLMAWAEGDRKDYAAAESWLVDTARLGYDLDAVLQYAALFEWERPGVSGDAKRAVEIYEHLAGYGKAEARRRLALMALQGRNMPKDPAKARAWLEPDAKAGDHESEGLLGILLLGETGTPKEEAEGVRWVERAIAGGDPETSAQYAQWLFYRKATDASRAKALEVWRTGMRNKDDGAANNFAWMLCSTRNDAYRDPKAGMDAVREMGDVDDLGWGYQDTVAACRAASGDFAGAVALQKHVVEQWLEQIDGRPADADNDKQTRDLKDRLALYEAGKVFIQSAEDEG